MKRTSVTLRSRIPLYTQAGRVCHTYLNGAPAQTRVIDDFGNSVDADKSIVLWYIRGPVPAYQPEY